MKGLFQTPDELIPGEQHAVPYGKEAEQSPIAGLEALENKEVLNFGLESIRGPWVETRVSVN